MRGDEITPSLTLDFLEGESYGDLETTTKLPEL
jgi:hypothetical protein